VNNLTETLGQSSSRKSFFYCFCYHTQMKIIFLFLRCLICSVL